MTQREQTNHDNARRPPNRASQPVSESQQREHQQMQQQQQQQSRDGRFSGQNPSRRRKDALRFFAASTTAHGFHKLNQPTRGLQLSWFCLIAGAFCGLTVHLAILVIKFYDEPITTKVDPKGSDFVYPDVTICNKMMFGISNIIKQDSTADGTFNYSLRPEFQSLYDDIRQVRDILNRSVHQYLLESFGAYEKDMDLLRVKDDTVFNLPSKRESAALSDLVSHPLSRDAHHSLAGTGRRSLFRAANRLKSESECNWINRLLQQH